MPTTSAVNPEEYAAFFLKLREENPEAEIIHIAYSSKASCTYQNAKIALDELKDARIRLIDSETVSSGIALLLWKSAQVIQEAQSADQAVELIRGLIRRGTRFQRRLSGNVPAAFKGADQHGGRTSCGLEKVSR